MELFSIFSVSFHGSCKMYIGIATPPSTTQCIIESPHVSICSSELRQIQHSLVRPQNVISTQQVSFALTEYNRCTCWSNFVLKWNENKLKVLRPNAINHKLTLQCLWNKMRSAGPGLVFNIPSQLLVPRGWVNKVKPISIPTKVCRIRTMIAEDVDDFPKGVFLAN